MRTSAIACATLVAATLLHVQPASAGAQSCESTATITGATRTSAGIPVPQVELRAPGGATTSDADGRFRVAVCAGRHLLSVRRIGYKPQEFPFEARADGTIEVIVPLEAVVLELEPVVVTARQSPTARRLRDFYIRRQRSAGHFLTREELAAHDGRSLTDVLRLRVPGVRLIGSTSQSRVRLRNQRCAPMVWLDGMSTPAGEFDIDVVQTSGVAAIEVYSGPATIPAEFRTPFGRDGCGGVIVIWSRIGRDQWDMPRRGRAEVEVAGATVTAPLQIFRAEEVDVPAAVDSSAMVQPLYPDSLFAFAVAGAVVAEFVVDTSGRPVAGSIRIVSATSPEFGEAVERAVILWRFHPARKDDRKVRQYVTLPFHFKTGT